MRGGQIQVDEFPPFNSITKLQNTSGRDDDAVPVDAHRLPRHERAYPPLADVHVRRAISYAIDRKRDHQVGAVRPRQRGELVPAAAGAVLRARHAAASSTTWRRRRPSSRSRSTRTASRSRCSSARARRSRTRWARSSSRRSSRSASTSRFKTQDTSTEFQIDPAAQVPARLQLLDDGHRRSGRARRRSPSTRPAARSSSSPATRTRRSIKLSHQAQKRAEPGEAAGALLEDPAHRGEGRLHGFLYYSPFRWAYTSKLHGFFVQPLGNYHLEDAWLG